MLENLVCGHAPDKGGCDRGVIGACDTSSLALVDCELFGCGTEGLTLVNVSHAIVDRVTVRDCTAGILSVNHSNDVRFERCRFVGNEEYHGVKVARSRDVALVDCTIEKNRASDPLLSVERSHNVVVSGGTIRANTAPRLAHSPDAPEIERVEIVNNGFDAP